MAVLLAAVLAGCGVPDSGAPMVDGTPRPMIGDPHNEEKLRPPKPEDASDSHQAVQLYFQAASSEWSALFHQVGPFLSADARQTLKPLRGIQVVRVSDWGEPQVRSETVHRIRVRGEVIGELTEDGVLEPARRSFSHTFQLRYTPVGDTFAWLIDNPPLRYVLSVEAMTERFEAVSVYFSNQWSFASLVPDLRYVPRSVDWRKQRSLLVDWLLRGPSSRFASVAARGFPEGTKRLGNVYVDDGHLVVNLSSEADASDRKDLLLAQLTWTLRSRMTASVRSVQLRIDNRPVRDRGHVVHQLEAFRGLNAVDALPDESLAYYITEDDEVGTLPARRRPAGLPAVLTASKMGDTDYNSAVESAALSRAGDLAALVRRTGEEQGLWIGRLRSSQAEATYRRVTGLPKDDLGSPRWVGGSAKEALLIVADGQLYEIDMDNLRARTVSMPDRFGDLETISVAPDGYRAALVADGKLYVAGLPQHRDGLALRDPHEVSPRIRDAVDVAWSREDRMVVAGTGPGRGGLWEVGVDGLIDDVSLPTPGYNVPDDVAAYPKLSGRGRVLIQQSGRVYEIYSNTFGDPGDAATAPVGANPMFSR